MLHALALSLLGSARAQPSPSEEGRRNTFTLDERDEEGTSGQLGEPRGQGKESWLWMGEGDLCSFRDAWGSSQWSPVKVS